MRLWLIPTIYIAASIVCAFTLPRIEHSFFSSYTFNISVASAQAYLSAAASGMMALTAIVFSIAFVMVQFSAIAYSPRLVLLFVRDRTLFHTLGVFVATFLFSLSALVWVDRGGSGAVPLFSVALVAIMVIASTILFALLVQRLNALQISQVLHLIGDRGREVIEEMFQPADRAAGAAVLHKTWRVSAKTCKSVGQILKYFGPPRTVARYNIPVLLRQAQSIDAVVEIVSAVGDTLTRDAVIPRVRGAKAKLSETEMMRAVVLARERTFEQDPKYAIRLLVDIAIKALSPAINDPTTAVQTIDQIEDLLQRLGQCNLDIGHVCDASGSLRLVFPTPSWDDYLALAFDEIRQFGATSVQVLRRLRSALIGLAQSLTIQARVESVHKYIRHLDFAIEHSALDSEDRLAASKEDRQGLGLSRAQDDVITRL
jgi:uncharacterized membrane protein